jgi:hypothetical protein
MYTGRVTAEQYDKQITNKNPYEECRCLGCDAMWFF